MKTRFKWLRDLIHSIIGKDRVPEEHIIDLPQVETPKGFIPIRDLPFNKQMLHYISNRRLTGTRVAVRKQAASTSGMPTGKRYLLEGTEQSELTFCPECIEQGRKSQSFVGPVFATCLPVDEFYDGSKNYHCHDPNLQRLTYLCGNGHRWERERQPRCWCEWKGGGGS